MRSFINCPSGGWVIWSTPCWFAGMSKRSLHRNRTILALCRKPCPGTDGIPWPNNWRKIAPQDFDVHAVADLMEQSVTESGLHLVD